MVLQMALSNNRTDIQSNCLDCISEICATVLNEVVVIGLESQKIRKCKDIFEIQERALNQQLRCLHVEKFLMDKWYAVKKKGG